MMMPKRIEETVVSRFWMESMGPERGGGKRSKREDRSRVQSDLERIRELEDRVAKLERDLAGAKRANEHLREALRARGRKRGK